MMKRSLFLLAVLLASGSVVGTIHAQPKRKPNAKPSAAVETTAKGVLYFGGEGQGIQTILLRTPERIVEISVTRKTRVVGFPEDNSAWNLGSEWLVTYYKSKDAALGLEAETVTFTGNSNSAIANAEIVVREYLMAISPDKNDFKKAYTNLGAALRRNLSIDDFEGMYEGVGFETKTIRVCSHSKERVALLVTYFGDDWDVSQRLEINETSGKPLINSLSDFEQDVPKAEAACRKLDR